MQPILESGATKESILGDKMSHNNRLSIPAHHTIQAGIGVQLLDLFVPSGLGMKGDGRTPMPYILSCFPHTVNPWKFSQHPYRPSPKAGVPSPPSQPSPLQGTQATNWGKG